MSPGAIQPSHDTQWVLVISDDTEFARELEIRWQGDRHAPHISSMTSEVWQESALAGCDLAIVGPVYSAALPHVLLLAASAPAALAFLPPSVSLPQVRVEHPNVLALPESSARLDVALCIGKELLLRRIREKQLERVERMANDNQRFATLGRYLLDARHNFNNALTTVLGTVELMQIQAPQSPEEVGDQVKTIQMMALRLQGIMQRFSSLESEMRFNESRTTAQSGLLRFPSPEPQGVGR